MARALACLGLLLGMLSLAWAGWWLVRPPEIARAFDVGLVFFGLVAIYSGLSVLRSGRL